MENMVFFLAVSNKKTLVIRFRAVYHIKRH